MDDSALKALRWQLTHMRDQQTRVHKETEVKRQLLKEGMELESSKIELQKLTNQLEAQMQKIVQQQNEIRVGARKLKEDWVEANLLEN
jgi:hypothetical protein